MTHDPSPPDAAGERAVRLLQQMHRVLSHDLPNQLVALQSLLQMLDMEDLAGLSPDAREYVRRLGSAAGKAGAMVRFLKEMARLHDYEPRAESFNLAVITPDVCSDVEIAFPETAFECRIRCDACRVHGDPRLIRLAVVEVLRYLVGLVSAVRVAVTLEAEPGPDRVMLRGAVRAAHDPPGTPLRPAEGDPEQSCELVLARAWLAAGGGTLARAGSPADPWQFSITLARETTDD
jgi:hypothetical protein